MKFIISFVLSAILLFGCNTRAKSNESIIADEEAKNFINVLEVLEEKFKETNKFSVKSTNNFEREFIINKVLHKKAYNIRYKSTNIGINVRCYNYSEFDGATIVKENYFYKVKKFEEQGVEKGVFAIFNNYNVVTIDYACDIAKRKTLAKDIIPIVYSSFKLPDSRILNLECGDYINQDAELY